MMGKIVKALQFADFHINRILATAAGILIFLCMFLISFNIGGRYLLGVIIPSAVEMSELVMVLTIFLSITFIELKGGHLRIMFLYSRLPTKGQLICNTFAKIIALVIFAFLSWQTLLFALYSWNTNEMSWGLLPIPLWIGKFGIFLGCLLFFLHSIGSLVINVKKLFGGVP